MNAQSSMVRLATVDDIDWLAVTIKDFYGDLVDIERCKQYFRATLGRPDHVYLRGERSCGGARYSLPFWAPVGAKPLASDIFFCPKPERAAILELVQVMSGLVEWARKSNCRQMSFAALNGADISGISGRAGAADPMPCFRVKF